MSTGRQALSLHPNITFEFEDGRKVLVYPILHGSRIGLLNPHNEMYVDNLW